MAHQEVTHQHQWVYLCEGLLSYTKRALEEMSPDLSRIEMCIDCGTVRAQLPSGRWAEVKSLVTRKSLEKFDNFTDVVLKDTPLELQFTRTPRSKNRLGRGLADLMAKGTKMKEPTCK